MKPRVEIKLFNAGLVFILYLLMGVYSCSHAQALQRICEKGYEVSFGMHNFSPRGLNEGITRISPGSRGISLGAFSGNNLLKIRMRGLGYYESTNALGYNFYQYEAELSANFYPFEFMRVCKNTIDFYLVTGLNYTHINFDNNLSPFKSKSFNRFSRVTGIGVECLVRKTGKTIAVFTDATVGQNLQSDESQEGPLPSMISAVNIGVRVGYKKSMKVKPGF
jgi:hypothetical protein